MKTPWWFLHKTPLALILMPVSWIYYVISRIVFHVRRARVYKPRRPVVCIGNIFAGGVGKTPVVRAVATYFDAPVVMRGYKQTAETGNAGDEATMLSRDGLQVHTGNRKSNVMLLDKQTDDNTPIIMDDGFQNPTVEKTLSVLVFDEGLGFGNGLLLPAGPLREPKFAVRRADAIVVIRNARPKRNFSLPTHIPVFYAHNQTVSPYDENTPLVAFAGIGYPKKFFAALPNVVATRSFPDHWQYTADDIQKLIALAAKKNAKLITTEKDWVRLPVELRDDIKYACLVTTIDTTFFDWLKGKVENNGNIKN